MQGGRARTGLRAVEAMGVVVVGSSSGDGDGSGCSGKGLRPWAAGGDRVNSGRDSSGGKGIHMGGCNSRGLGDAGTGLPAPKVVRLQSGLLLLEELEPLDLSFHFPLLRGLGYRSSTARFSRRRCFSSSCGRSRVCLIASRAASVSAIAAATACSSASAGVAGRRLITPA